MDSVSKERATKASVNGHAGSTLHTNQSEKKEKKRQLGGPGVQILTAKSWNGDGLIS